MESKELITERLKQNRNRKFRTLSDLKGAILHKTTTFEDMRIQAVYFAGCCMSVFDFFEVKSDGSLSVLRSDEKHKGDRIVYSIPKDMGDRDIVFVYYAYTYTGCVSFIVSTNAEIFNTKRITHGQREII